MKGLEVFPQSAMMAKKKVQASKTRERRTFTDELKRDAVQMLLNGHSVASVSKKLGINNANLLYRWKAEKGVRYPICVEGERTCPPEDVGGVWGYADFLEAIADPKHHLHDDSMEWAGDFDPEEFDSDNAATKAMRRGLPNWRHDK